MEEFQLINVDWIEGNLHFHLYNTTVVIIIDKMLKFTDKNLRRNRMFELPQSTPFQDVYQYKAKHTQWGNLQWEVTNPTITCDNKGTY